MRPIIVLVAVVLAAAFAAVAISSVPATAQGLEIPENGYVVSDDLSLLPPDVRKTRDDLMAAAMSGDIDKLGKIIAAQPSPVTVSFGEPPDEIEYLKGESRDGTGVAIMAILANLLDAPYAAMDGGDGEPVYVWPYLAVYEDLRALSDEELVDAYRIMGLDNFRAYQEIGGWLWWRVYIGPGGRLQAFVAGD
jgi:hypothetical protein